MWIPKHYRAEVGYELSKEYWGMGIGSEALKTVLNYGYHHFQLERIEALIEPSNLPTQKLLEKQGVTQHYKYTCGKFNDLYMYSIIKEEINSLRRKR